MTKYSNRDVEPRVGDSVASLDGLRFGWVVDTDGDLPCRVLWKDINLIPCVVAANRMKVVDRTMDDYGVYYKNVETIPMVGDRIIRPALMKETLVVAFVEAGFLITYRDTNPDDRIYVQTDRCVLLQRNLINRPQICPIGYEIKDRDRRDLKEVIVAYDRHQLTARTAKGVEIKVYPKVAEELGQMVVPVGIHHYMGNDQLPALGDVVRFSIDDKEPTTGVVKDLHLEDQNLMINLTDEVNVSPKDVQLIRRGNPAYVVFDNVYKNIILFPSVGDDVLDEESVVSKVKAVDGCRITIESGQTKRIVRVNELTLILDNKTREVGSAVHETKDITLTGDKEMNNDKVIAALKSMREKGLSAIGYNKEIDNLLTVLSGDNVYKGTSLKPQVGDLVKPAVDTFEVMALNDDGTVVLSDDSTVRPSQLEYVGKADM